jgi:hypothetical protein
VRTRAATPAVRDVFMSCLSSFPPAGGAEHGTPEGWVVFVRLIASTGAPRCPAVEAEGASRAAQRAITPICVISDKSMLAASATPTGCHAHVRDADRVRNARVSDADERQMSAWLRRVLRGPPCRRRQTRLTARS